jgi:hypothetical protein
MGGEDPFDELEARHVKAPCFLLVICSSVDLAVWPPKGEIEVKKRRGNTVFTKRLLSK